MKVYLAASFAAKTRMREIRDDLHYWGYSVTSRWIDSDGEGIPGKDIAARYRESREEAIKDLRDIAEADAVAIFTDVPSTTGAMYVELGMAIVGNKPIYLVGPVTNIFMTLSRVQAFSSYEAFAAMMMSDLPRGI